MNKLDDKVSPVSSARGGLTLEEAERWSRWLGVDVGNGANTWLRDALRAASRGEVWPRDDQAGEARPFSAPFVPTKEQACYSPLLVALSHRGETERQVIEYLFVEVESLRLKLIKRREADASGLLIHDCGDNTCPRRGQVIESPPCSRTDKARVEVLAGPGDRVLCSTCEHMHSPTDCCQA